MKDIWARVHIHPVLSRMAEELPETWDSIKKLIPTPERMKDIYSIESEYLSSHPNSGYFTDILGLTGFPDYIDDFPHGAIVRKVGIMAYLPKAEESRFPFVAISRDEYRALTERAADLAANGILENRALCPF